MWDTIGIESDTPIANQIDVYDMWFIDESYVWLIDTLYCLD